MYTKKEEVFIFIKYIKYHIVCLLAGIGTPSPASKCASPRNQEVGGPNSDDWRESLVRYSVYFCGWFTKYSVGWLIYIMCWWTREIYDL